MQASNGCHNGESASTSNDLQNGTCSFEDNVEINGDVHKTISTKIRSQTDQDIIRLIGQHLRGLGLKYVYQIHFYNYVCLIYLIILSINLYKKLFFTIYLVRTTSIKICTFNILTPHPLSVYILC